MAFIISIFHHNIQQNSLTSPIDTDTKQQLYFTTNFVYFTFNLYIFTINLIKF
jgi:hypothetical protein